jgi:SAM-dependent methyltransferase
MIKDDFARIKSHFNNLENLKDHGCLEPAAPDLLETADGRDWIGAFWILREKQIFERVRGLIPLSSRVLEVGCGVGALIERFARDGFDCAAIDISEKMVAAARSRLAPYGDRISVELSDIHAYSVNGFDATVSNGVICYYRDQHAFLIKLAGFVKIGGIIAVSHRNALFNLFTFNNGTISFLKERLLGHLSGQERDEVIDRMTQDIPELASPVDIYSNSVLYRSAENPLTVANLYRDAGIKVETILHTCIHPAPPRFSKQKREGDVVAATAIYENSWEGLFLGSQFIVIGRKV